VTVGAGVRNLDAGRRLKDAVRHQRQSNTRVRSNGVMPVM
jgi:hypothetical protein